ncbi:hypothetical protein Tco_1124519 [Tanacetum coccineum]|uniref:Retrotransposon gag domain-containing protein n=1 Tax=Tanacetum coccineum TaxID=301880 RepID=A0ABQ5J6R5_9ASTR
MPPRRASVGRRALVSRRALSARTANNLARNASTTTDAPMSVVAINQLIETRVTEALVNQEQLRSSGVNGKGVVGLTQWFEKMESVFHISNYTVENQVKLATCTLLGATLTWWNSHVKTVGHDAAYGMPWKTLTKMMIFKYCLRSEIKKLEIEIWNLKKVRSYAERQAENKRKFDNNNQAQQQLLKRQNVAQAYADGTGERKEFAGTLPLCNKCKFQHNGQYRSICPKLWNRNYGNQAEDTKAHGLVFALGVEETDQDPNNIEDEIEAQEEDFLALTSEPYVAFGFRLSIHSLDLFHSQHLLRIMPPRRALVARRAPVARKAPSARTANNPTRNASTTTDAPMSVAAINQLIKTRVAEALANQEQLRNSGVVGLTQWFEKMESVFHISNCTIENQVKFATCTLLCATLIWWNSHVTTVGHDVVMACPGNLSRDVFLRNSDEVEKVLSIGLLPDMIKEGSAYAERQAENKRKFDNNNQAQQQLPKRQNVVQAYTIGSGEKRVCWNSSVVQ